MDYSQESFSFYPMLMFSFAGIVLYNYVSILDYMIHGVGKGKIKVSKGNATVDSTMGVVHLPNVKLPSLDWEVKLFKETDENSSVKDGLNNLDVVSSLDTIDCKVNGRTLICEFVYPEQLGVETIRGYVSSIFDDECYVFTVNRGEMIDYRSFANSFMLLLEDL